MATNSNLTKPDLIDELPPGHDLKTLFESGRLLDELKKALAARILNAKMDHHLGQDPEQAAGNHCKGSSSKTVLTDNGKLQLSIPRDRHGRFDLQLIAKYQRRFPGFDQKVITLYARGMSTRDVSGRVRCTGYANISAKWKSPPISWHAAKAQLALQFQDRFIISA
jgi:putative transposase